MNTCVLISWCLVRLVSCLVQGLSMEDMPVNVTRRYSMDMYHLYMHSTPSNCTDGGISTFLVDDGQCIEDDRLIDECDFVLTPSEEPSNSTLALLFVNGTTTAMTYSTNNTPTTAKVTQNGSINPVNGSRCQIASLEVYRGRAQAINISYGGLSLDDNGDLMIMETELAYDRLDYIGEVYRMNISCLNGDDGCLFFKVLGTTDLTKAKFNGSVPGILPNARAELKTTEATTTTENPFRFMNGSPLFYSVVAIGSTAIAVLSCLMILCLVLQCRSQYHRKNLFTIRKNPVVHVQRGQSTIYDDIFVIGQSDSQHPLTEEYDAAKNETKASVTIPKYEECGSGGDTKQSRRPTEQYSMLVQVGGRNSFVDDPIPRQLVIEENAYAQLHETSL